MLHTRNIAIFILIFLLAACALQPITSTPTPAIKTPELRPLPELPALSIVRHPNAAIYRWMNTPGVSKFDPNSMSSSQVDLRSSYLKNLDLSGAQADLLHADFDSKTEWPSPDKMPAGFDPQKIMQLGKNPGLEVRSLHARGITGRGVGIAIIDQTLLVEHIEYRDQLRLYEEGDYFLDNTNEAQMHGPAVASIAVGKTVGIAPQADLYYIGIFCFDGKETDFACMAKSVRRIIEINRQLPEGRKIRVLSMSIGWDEKVKGYTELKAALGAAAAQNILVISAAGSQDLDKSFLLSGLGREPLADPQQISSYVPARWWAQSFFSGSLPKKLLMPMDSRAIASPTGPEDYAFYREGGTSWVAPYLAGVYALALQVQPELTPQNFWKLAFRTGRNIPIQQAGKQYTLGVILDPLALIAELQR